MSSNNTKHVLIEEELNQIVKELWEDYKKTVRIHGYVASETKNILTKIYSLAPKE